MLMSISQPTETGSPGYLFAEIPPEHEQWYNVRNSRAYDQNVARTTCFLHTYFHNVRYEWNLLDHDIKNSQSISEFKEKLLASIRPPKNTVYDVFDIEGIRKLTKLRVNFSALNEHRFRHNCDCSSPTCICRTCIRHQFDLMRRDLFASLSSLV